jgi:beta-galactosidase
MPEELAKPKKRLAMSPIRTTPMPRMIQRKVLRAALMASGFLFAATAATAVAAQNGPVRQDIALGEGWRFQFGASSPAMATPDFADGGWQAVSIPHTWNRIGAYEDASYAASNRPVDKDQGIGWYRRHFIAPALTGGKHAFLQFDAASRKASIWINGQHVGDHAGGFSRFRFDVTPFLRPGADNVLAVQVDSSQPALGSSTADILPLTGDFFVPGGLYRPVSLIITNPAHFDMLDAGGPGVYAKVSALSDHSATVRATLRLRGEGGTARRLTAVTRLVDAQGKTVASAQTPVVLSAGTASEIEQSLTVTDPHLWQGVASPYLYRLVAELRRGTQVLDRVEQDYGIRQIRIDPDKGLFLNGRHVRLNGVAMHQDSMAHGWALTEQDSESMVAAIRDIGANAIRLAHYQHGEAIHRLADRYGLLLWDEVPYVTDSTVDPDRDRPSEGLRANARQQLVEEIRQNFNHPSVAVWSVANEVDFAGAMHNLMGAGHKVAVDPRPLVRELHELAKKEDPTRATTLATCCEDMAIMKMGDAPVVADITDVSASNRYFGWYYGTPEMYGPQLDMQHARRPTKPLGISEYGAGAATFMHTDNPEGGAPDSFGARQPEEYQAWYHEKNWAVLSARPYLWATFVWNMFDFSSKIRHEGGTTDINTKGLVTYDGKVAKDAYYFYRANWNPAPTVHIVGRRYVDRAYGVNDVRVYSNAPRTELMLNGRSLGVRADCPQKVCVWSAVRLDAGANRLEARGTYADKVQSDAIDWQFDGARRNLYRIDAGALMAATAQAGRYGSDAFFSGGQGLTMDEAGFGKPPLHTAIADTPDRDLLVTYREGDFHYRLPLDNGTYRVTLHFAEPGEAAGARVFDVTANGAVQLPGFDIAARAGGARKAIAQSFEVTVTDGQLDLGFTPRKGKALVSALSVEPLG